MNICFATSELAPLAKTGGLADVSYALTALFQAEGHDTRVLMPLYGNLNTAGAEIEAVSGLDSIEIELGGHGYQYSIRRVTLPAEGPVVHLLDCPELFGGDSLYGGDDEHIRFLLLSRAAIEMCRQMDFAPDIFHCHDWHTAIIPLYLKTLYADDPLFEHTRSVLTIHNIGYQGLFGTDVVGIAGLQDFPQYFDQMEMESGQVNFMKEGVMHADLLTTVSPTYAREILDPEYGMGLEWHLNYRKGDLVGILNGVDYQEWDPGNDPHIPHPYSARKLESKEANKKALLEELGMEYQFDRPLFGMVTRLTYQKGLELVQYVVPELMRERDFSLAVVGSGEQSYVDFFEWLQQEFPGRVGIYHGYNNPLAHRVEAGSDAFLMPSRYEPCGLNQMYSLRYGTVPVVRATGGLADSVRHYDPRSGQGTGVVFHDFDANGLRWAMNTTLDFYGRKRDWRRLVSNGMAVNYSWQEQGAIYLERFKRLMAR